MLLGAVVLSLHNVLVRVIFQSSSVLGSDPIGGWLDPGWPASLLLFQMRAVVAMLFMIISARWFNPKVIPELHQFFTQAPSWLQRQVLASGINLFLGLSLLYLALAYLPAGIAITTFFMFPAVTILLAWLILKERPQNLQLLLGGVILAGVLLTTPLQNGSAGDWIVGSGAAILASVIYAFYGLQAQQSLAKLHPVPFSLILFVISAVLSTLMRLFFPVQVDPEVWPILWLCSLGTGSSIWIGYLAISYGIQQIGVTTAFLISAATPILTVLAARIGIAEMLNLRQLFGVILVALGIAILGLSKRSPL